MRDGVRRGPLEGFPSIIQSDWVPGGALAARGTRLLGEAIARCKQPPPVWLNASTATIYKHSFDRPMDEATGEIGATPEAKDAFSVEVART